MTSIISKKITPITMQPPTNTTSMIGSVVSSALHKVVSTNNLLVLTLVCVAYKPHVMMKVE